MRTVLGAGNGVQLPEPEKGKPPADDFPPDPEHGTAVREVAERRAMLTSPITQRDDWKKVVHLNHLRFDEWLQGYCTDKYYEGVHDCVLAIIMCLHDDHRFGNKRMKPLLEHIYDVVDSLNKKDMITPQELLEGLKSIGFDIAEYDAIVKKNGHKIKGAIIK